MRTPDRIGRAQRHASPPPAQGQPPASAYEADLALACQALPVVTRVPAAVDIPAAVDLLREATAALGADAAVFMACVRGDFTVLTLRQLLACDARWSSQYASGNWAVNDPWLAYATQHGEPVTADTLPLASEQARWVADGARHFGFASALIVPVPTLAARSRVGVLVIGSHDTGRFTARCLQSPVCVPARALALELSDWMHRRMRQELVERARLTEEDLVLLRHQHAKHGSKAIAQELQTGPKAIDTRFKRLCLRLGTANRRAAAQLAVAYGLI